MFFDKVWDEPDQKRIPVVLRVLNMMKQTVFTRTSFMDPEPDFPNPDFFPVRTQEKKSDPDPDKRTRIRNTGGDTRTS